MSFKSFYPKFVNKCGFLSLQLKDLNFSIKYLLFFEKLLIQILWRFRTIEAFPKFYFYVPENFDYQCKKYSNESSAITTSIHAKMCENNLNKSNV